MKLSAVSEAALILAPHGRDAAVAAAMLAEASIESVICAALPELTAKLDQGTGLVIIAEEALATADVSALAAWVKGQQSWSDMPVVLLASHGGGPERNPAAARYGAILGNVTVIERPFHPTTLISLARAALRARRRQYEARARMDALRDSEEFNRRILQSSADCIKVLDLDGHLEFMSDGGQWIMEVDDFAKIQGQHWPDFWKGEEHPKALAAIAEAREGRTGRFQGFGATMKGTPKWWDVMVTAITGAQGAAERLLAISRDVSEQKRAETALRDSEARYRALFENIDAGFCVAEVDLQGAGGLIDYRIAEANPAFYRQTGFAEGILNRWLREAAPALEEHWYETYGRIARTGEPARFEEGSDMLGRWFDVFAFRVGEPKERRVAILFNDITQRRAMEQTLRRLNETLEERVAERTAERNLLATIVETTDSFIQVCGLDYRWLAINKAAVDEFERIFGKRPQVGDSMLDILEDQPEHQAALKAVWARALAGEEYTVIEEFGDPKRSRRAYEIKFNALRDGKGERIGAFQIVADVTERIGAQKRLLETQDALRQSQKMEAVGQLTGGVAHDFNNLLTIIKSSISLMQRPNVTEEKRSRYMDAIAETVDRGAKLTSHLLAFSRRQSLKPEAFDVAQRLGITSDMLRSVVGDRIRIVTEIGQAPCCVEADIAQFETAIVNMALNARDAMWGEGTLTIRLDDGVEMPSAAGDGADRFAAISLIDTGAGIAPDKLAQIFEPFFTTKAVGKGTGLGLSQVYGFAQQSGGDIKVESRVGHGARFTLYLPQVEKKIEAAPAPIAEARGDEPQGGGGRRVLLVEDNVQVGAFAKQLLGDLGYETTWVTSGNEALATLGQDSRYDAVFSDVVMPGISGLEMGQAIRRLYPGLPVVLASGYSQALAGEGRDGFELLQKPYAVEDVARVLRNATATHGRGAADESDPLRPHRAGDSTLHA